MKFALPLFAALVGGFIHPTYNPDVAIPSPTTYAKRVVDGSTVALFHFDEGTGSTSADATSTYTASLSSVTWLGTDGGNHDSASPRVSFPTGSALVFNGSSSVASVTGLLDTIPATGSIDCWFRPAIAYPATGKNARIFSKATTDNGGDPYRLDVFLAESDGKLTVVLKSASGNQTLKSTRTTWTADTDYHMTLTWGTNGMMLYVNGVLHDWLIDFVMPANGSFHPFDFGALFFGGVHETNSFFQGSIDEFRLKNAQQIPEEIHASYQRWPYSVGIEENGRWIERTNILSPLNNGSFEADLVIEPSTPVFDGSLWHMFYTGYRISGFTGQIGHVTSPDGTTWTRQGAVIGSGNGGESATWVSGMEVVNLGGGNLVGFYASNFTDLNRTVSSDWGATWSKTGVAVSGTAQGWMAGISNSGVLIDGSIWRLLFESGNAGAGEYYLGSATSTDQGVTWTLYAGNPLSSLAWQPGGTYSGPSIVKVGDLYHLWYHAAVKIPSPPNCTTLAHAISSDFINWTGMKSPPLLTMVGETFSGGRADQYADPTKPTLISGQYYMYYDVDRNVGTSGVQGRIDRVRWTTSP